MTRRGRFVVLLGPDGSGKSTLLSALAEGLAGRFAGVTARHYRPQHPWGRGAPEPQPHARRPRAAALSALKALLDLLRFRLGFRAQVRPRLRRGELVLFDRYYHDVLADPRRYRYGGPPGLARWVGRHVPLPDLFVVLDAPEQVLQARKAEVPAAESRAARAAYRRLADELPGGRLVDATRPPAELAGEVSALILAAGGG